MTSSVSELPSYSLQDVGEFTPALVEGDELHQSAEKVLGHCDFLDVLQLSRRGGLALIRHQGGLKVFKFINCRADWKKRWARWIGWNPARRALRMSRALDAAGIAVCEVEEYGGVSLPSAPRAVWTMSRYVENGRTLRQLKQDLQQDLQQDRHAPSHPVIKRLFDDCLVLLRRIHDAGFEHRDYHAGNLLVTGAPDFENAELRLVDLETVMQRRASPLRRARDLRRFLDNFVEAQSVLEVVSSALDHYTAGDDALKARIMATRRMQGLLRKYAR